MRKVNRLVAGTMLAACVGVANAGTPEILDAVAYQPMTGQEMESVSGKVTVLSFNRDVNVLSYIVAPIAVGLLGGTGTANAKANMSHDNVTIFRIVKKAGGKK